MDVTDPQWDSHPGMQKFRAFMAKYYPEADRSESGPLTRLQYLDRAGRGAEAMRRQSHARERHEGGRQHGFRDQHLHPGIRIKTSPTDFYPIEQVQMMRFTGENWQLFGPIIDGHAE